MSDVATTLMPMTATRNLGDFPIGNLPLSVHHERLCQALDLVLDPRAWVDGRDVEAMIEGGGMTLVDAWGQPLAWVGASPDLSSSIQASASFLIHYPWDLLRANEQWVSSLEATAIVGEVHSSATITGVLHLGAGSTILPGVVIDGNVVIGERCRIGPNCYLRGSTSIGDDCVIGQAVEIKNSVILARTRVCHLSYVGDSLIGEDVNLGAGTITANFRHDAGTHRTMVDGALVDSGRNKLGAIIGDGVHTGIHTSIYPGRKLWPGASTRPGEVVDRDLQ